MSHLTEKFLKTLKKFNQWINKSYILQNKQNKDTTLCTSNLLSSFVEPPRKKLHVFVKLLFNEYNVKDKNNNVIENYTIIVSLYDNYIDELKNNKKLKKIKNTIKETNIDSDEDINDQENEDDTLFEELSFNDNNTNQYNNNEYDDTEQYNDNDNNNDEYDDIEKIISMLSNVLINDKITIDNNIDTSDTWWLSNLNFNYYQLRNAFGEPLLTGGDDNMHLYEWKFKYNSNIYSIYDWKFNNISFKPINEVNWFLCGNSDNRNDLLNVLRVLNNIINKN